MVDLYTAASPAPVSVPPDLETGNLFRDTGLRWKATSENPAEGPETLVLSFHHIALLSEDAPSAAAAAAECLLLVALDALGLTYAQPEVASSVVGSSSYPRI